MPRATAAKLRPLVKELELRCGTMKQAAVYAGLGHMTLYRILWGDHEQVNEKTARLIILALYQKRKEDRRNGSSETFRKALVEQAKREVAILSHHDVY